MSDKYIRIHLDTDQANKNAKDLDKEINSLDTNATLASKSMNKLALAISGVIAGGALVAFLKDSIRVTMNFNAAMTRVGAITRATDEQLAQLTATARELGATTEFSAEQAANGLQFLGMAGFEVEESISALPGVLDLATISAMDLGSAADITSNIMSGFGIQAEDTSGVIDVLAATSVRANTDVQQLGSAMSFVAPIAQSFGIGIEESAAAIGKLSDAGIQGERAGTGLRTVLASLAKQSGPAEKALAKLGLTAAQISPQTNSLTDIIDKLRAAGLTATDAFEIFGAEGAPAILALTSQSSGLRSLTEELRDVEGAASNMASTFRDTLGGDVKTLQSSVQDLQITLGNMFSDEARDSVQGLTEAVRFVSENMEGIIDVVEMLAALFGTRLAVAIVATSVAFTQQQAAALKSTVTMNAMGQVINRTTVATNALNVATRAASKGLALLGGPLGLIALASAAFLTYESSAGKAADVTEHLTGSIENLSIAQAKQEQLNLGKVLEEQTAATESLERRVSSLNEKLQIAQNHGSELVRATVPGLKKEIKEANVQLELSSENLGKLAQRYLHLGNIIKGVKFETPDTPNPDSDIPPEIGLPADDTDKTIVTRLEETTAAMQRELEKRRVLRQLHGSLVLADGKAIWDQEKAQAEYAYQEALINEGSRYIEEKARRDARFVELLEDDNLKREQRAAIQAQWDEQNRIAKEIHESEITRIEEEGARARILIAEQEAQMKLQTVQDAGNTILTAFQGQSRKMFEIGKALALSSTVAQLPAAVEKAWENGGGYPWGIATAGARLAIGLSNIQKIRATKFNTSGGGSASASASGSVPTPTPSSVDSTSSTSVLQTPQIEQVDAIDFGPVINELRNQSGAVSTEFVARILESAQEASRLTGRTT